MEIRAIILAAGEGSRLRPYTIEMPKCLVEVGGKSLISRQLAVLASEGIDSPILVAGHCAEKLEPLGLKVYKNDRYAETNMVWSLFCAEDELSGDILICYGDIVYSREALKAVLECKYDIAVAIDFEWEAYWRERNEDFLADAETLRLEGDGRIIEIGQTPKTIAEIQGQYMGLIKLTSEGVRLLKNTFDKAKKSGKLRGRPIERAYMTDLLQDMIDSKCSIYSVPVHGGWVEVDTVSDLISEVTEKRLIQIESEL